MRLPADPAAGNSGEEPTQVFSMSNRRRTTLLSTTLLFLLICSRIFAHDVSGDWADGLEETLAIGRVVTTIDQGGDLETSWLTDSFFTSGAGSTETFTSTDNLRRRMYAVVIEGGLPPGWVGDLPYSITATVSGEGSIKPSGQVSVDGGDDQLFSIAPATGYRTVDVTVDGISVGPVTSYLFEGVERDHTIAATFRRLYLGVSPTIHLLLLP